MICNISNIFAHLFYASFISKSGGVLDRKREFLSWLGKVIIFSSVSDNSIGICFASSDFCFVLFLICVCVCVYSGKKKKYRIL